MNWQRKAIIISEIKYWRDNRLLPESYCDYLLALYTEGEGEQSDSTIEVNRNKRQNVLIVIFLLLNIAVAPGIAFFTLYVPINLIATTTLLISALVMSLGLSYIASKQYQIERKYTVLVLLLNLLILSMVAINQWVINATVTLVIIYLQLITWIALGIKTKNNWLLILGILGMIISIVAFII